MKITLKNYCIALLTAICCIALDTHAEEKLLIIGDATWGGWSLDNASVMNTTTENPDIFTYSGYLKADKEFKFLTEAAWDKPEYRNGGDSPYILGEGTLRRGGNDDKFKVALDGNYDIVCDLRNLKVSVTRSAYQEKPILHNRLYAVGDATPGGWALSQATPLDQDPSNPFLFSGKVKLNPTGSFKIGVNPYGDYGQKFFYRNADDNSGVNLDSAGDLQWKVNKDTTYLVTVDIDAMTIGMVETAPEERTAPQRICWYEPANARQDEPVTVFFNAAAGDAALKGYTGDIYITSGIVTDDNDDLSGLSHMIGPDGTTLKSDYTMIRSEQSPDLYTISFTPSRYYVLDQGDSIRMLGMKFASADGQIQAGAPDNDIIYVPFKQNTGQVWYMPNSAKETDEIVFYFDATLGNAALKGKAGNIYAHCGILTDESTDDSDWKHSSPWGDNSPRYRLTRTGADPDIYTFTVCPSEFFELDSDEHIDRFAFVMRDGSCSTTAKTDGDKNIIVELKNKYNSGLRSQLGKYVSHTDDGTTVAIQAENGTLSVTPYNDYIFKILTRRNGDYTPERRSISVSATPECTYSVSDENGYITIATKYLYAEIDKTNCNVRYTDKQKQVILAEAEGLNNSSVPRTATFAPMHDQAFYGGGYNGQRANLDGQTLVMNNTQTGGWESTWRAPHNICVPFVVSSSGYGIFFDDHYRNAALTPSSEGTTYRSGSLNPIAYYFVGGDGSMSSVLENYTFLTGRQELPPYWALGYMTSRYGYKSRTEAQSVIDNIKNASLPLDAIVFDLYWQGEGNSGMGNLDWYAPNWEQPEEMMRQFDEQGVKTICITEPFFTSVSANYQTLEQLGYFADSDVSGMEWLGAKRVGLIDASNPEAMDWMWKFYRQRTQEGVAGWWLDLGEPERHDADSRHLGGTVAQIHNEFGDLWTERVYRGLKEDFPDQRPFLMPRAGTAGMQRHSAFPWTGDIKRSWSGLEAQVPALISASMSGIGYMGSDVGGFSASSTDDRLYLRWIQMAVFSPMMRTHSTHLPEPYQDCYASVLPEVRKCLNLRYSYLPYTYTLAYENTTHGTPLARPVSFHDTVPSAELSSCKDQYLWGHDLLIAPVLDNTTSRDIIFPAGEWIDMNDMSKSYPGGTTIKYEAPLERLPYFGRKGSFITRFGQESYSSTKEIDNSRFEIIYLADLNSETPSAATLFDDDKKSTRSLAEREYVLTRFEGSNDPTGHTIRIANEGDGYEGMPAERTYTFIIPGYTRNIDQIRIEGDGISCILDQAASTESFKSADNVYYLDTDRSLHFKIKLPTLGNISVQIVGDKSALSTLRESDGGIVLTYNRNTDRLSYSLPEELNEASIRIYDFSGAESRSIGNIVADGTTRQFSLSKYVAPGLYIVMLCASTPNGDLRKKSTKVFID